jgi:hypothetical protein
MFFLHIILVENFFFDFQTFWLAHFICYGSGFNSWCEKRFFGIFKKGKGLKTVCYAKQRFAQKLEGGSAKFLRSPNYFSISGKIWLTVDSLAQCCSFALLRSF